MKALLAKILRAIGVRPRVEQHQPTERGRVVNLAAYRIDRRPRDLNGRLRQPRRHS